MPTLPPPPTPAGRATRGYRWLSAALWLGLTWYALGAAIALRLANESPADFDHNLPLFVGRVEVAAALLLVWLFVRFLHLTAHALLASRQPPEPPHA